jgi:hypothetical protein
MSKTVVIHQPDFLPYIGFFHRFLNAELWVILDNVQFIHKGSIGWQHRDKIKTPQGAKWITVSVQKCALGTSINEVLLSKSTDWRIDHLNLIRENYKKSAFFDEIFPYIEELYAVSCDKMIDFNMKSIEMLLKLFDIDIRSIYSSTLNPKGAKNERLIDILKKVDATVYLSGIGSRNYIDEKMFDENDIDIVWQDLKFPVYDQLHGDFIPYLSSIDLFLNCGIKKSQEIIRGC